MMGQRKREQEQLFYYFCLDDAVPDDHSVRELAAVLDLSGVYAELASYYPTIGRPSIDPVLMIRMLIVGYVFGIRSERALCREVQVNLLIAGFAGSRSRTGFRIIRRSHVHATSDSATVPSSGACSSVSLGPALRPLGRWRRLCCRCQPDRGRRQQASLDPWHAVAEGY